MKNVSNDYIDLLQYIYRDMMNTAIIDVHYNKAMEISDLLLKIISGEIRIMDMEESVNE